MAGEDGSMVAGVKKHPTKPMAYVAFVAPEKAQAVLASPPTSVCGVPVLPARQHATDPYSIVVKWREGTELEEEDIATEFDLLFQGADREVSESAGESATAPKAPVQLVLRPLGQCGKGSGGPRGGYVGQGAVRKVTKHGSKPVAFVAFQTPELAKLALANPSPVRAIGQTNVDPLVPHKSEPDTVVLFWRQGEDIAEDDIAWHFEELIAAYSGAKTRQPIAPWSHPDWGRQGKGPATWATSPAMQQHFVAGVKKHPALPIAFVNFASEEIAQAALSDPSAIQACMEIPVDPLVAHKTDPKAAVLFWKNGYDLSAEAIAECLEQYMQSLFGFGQSAEPIQPVTQSLPEGLDTSSPMVVAVRKHTSKSVAYVTLQTPDLALLAVQDPEPARRIANATVDPVEPHKSDPYSIVLFWRAGIDLSEEEIAVHFEARLNELLGGTGPELPSLEELKVSMGLDASQPFVAKVSTLPPKKTAFVTFQNPDLAQVVLQDPDPPRLFGSVPIDPLMQHRTDPCAVVLFWKNALTVDSDSVQEFYEARCGELLMQAEGLVNEAEAPELLELQGQPRVQVQLGRMPAAHPTLQARHQGPGAQLPWTVPPGAHATSSGGSGSLPGQLYETPEGVTVRKHGTQPMAFVVLPSEALAQAVLSDPPQSLSGVPVLQPRAHNSNPKAIVLRWMGKVDLPESAIAAGVQEAIGPLLEASLLSDGGESYAIQDSFPAARKRPAQDSGGDSFGHAAMKRFREWPS